MLGATVTAARNVGLRFHPTRGSMDLGVSSGGLPPDEVVEDLGQILAGTEQAISDFHDPAPGSMVRMGVAPCSPFSVTGELMREAAELARRHGLRLHTHLAESADEDVFCAERFGCTPVEYLDSLDWLADDVWLAHAIHLSDAAITRLAATGTGVAHCPSSNGRLGAGICRTADLVAAGVPVGLGVDGSASNEDSSMLAEAHQAVLMARAVGGPEAMTVRDSLSLATMGGARVVGRADEIGSIEIGKLADLALWRMDGQPQAGIADPVAALVLGPRPPLDLLLVNGRWLSRGTSCRLSMRVRWFAPLLRPPPRSASPLRNKPPQILCIKIGGAFPPSVPSPVKQTAGSPGRQSSLPVSLPVSSQ